MKHLTTILDKVANELEALGLKKLAVELDVVANTLESTPNGGASSKTINYEDDHDLSQAVRGLVNRAKSYGGWVDAKVSFEKYPGRVLATVSVLGRMTGMSEPGNVWQTLVAFYLEQNREGAWSIGREVYGRLSHTGFSQEQLDLLTSAFQKFIPHV